MSGISRRHQPGIVCKQNWLVSCSKLGQSAHLKNVCLPALTGVLHRRREEEEEEAGEDAGDGDHDVSLLARD